jgi:hypothetical protein
MDETTNNLDTSGIYTWNYATTNTDSVTTWIHDFEFTSWEPYLFEKYIPKWHIEKGYKYQIKHMWN